MIWLWLLILLTTLSVAAHQIGYNAGYKDGAEKQIEIERKKLK